MDRAGRNRGDQPAPAAAGTLDAASPGPGKAGDSGTTGNGTTGNGATGSGRLPAGTPAVTGPGDGRLRRLAARPAALHLALLACYLAAGIALTWPRASYLFRGQLPASRDVASYVWDLWWVPHQLVHLGNPWFTGNMAAPVGIQLGFDTTMPLAGLVMSPVTLAFGPSASFNLLTILMPGLLCYVMYRAARLWLRSQAGAIAAGAFFGLSSMLAEQDWTHLNIAAGTLFLPMTVEAAVRLRRRTGRRQAVILGLVLGGCLLVNQESAVMAAILAVLLLIPWLARRPARDRVTAVAICGVVALVAASPQLIAMAQQQASSGGARVDRHLLAVTSKKYGVGIGDLFAPAQRVGYYGLHQLAAASDSSPLKGPTAEAMPMFGLVLTVLAVLGLAVCWRRRSAWQLAGLWLGCAWLALGASLYVLKVQHVPFQQIWKGVRVSPVMPYTWLMRLPVLSAFREADRFAILGLVGAALLAGAAVDWLRYHARPLIIAVAAVAVLEAGYSAGPPSSGIMATALPALDGPIAADHSGSTVLDVPFGLRGGIPQYGKQMAPPALVIATADGHPRAVAYTSWVPSTTARGILSHAFYVQLMRAQSGIPLAPRRNPAGNQVTQAEIAAARQDLRGLGIGWALVWTRHPRPMVDAYLWAAGFRFDYRTDGAIVFKFAGK